MLDFLFTSSKFICNESYIKVSVSFISFVIEQHLEDVLKLKYKSIGDLRE